MLDVCLAGVGLQAGIKKTLCASESRHISSGISHVAANALGVATTSLTN